MGDLLIKENITIIIQKGDRKKQVYSIFLDSEKKNHFMKMFIIVIHM